MKDMKIFTIGFLSAICVLLVMGQNQKNLGHIEVQSISIKNISGTEILWLGASSENGGFLETYNSKGDRTTFLGTGASNIGFMRTYNQNGTNTTYVGTSGKGEFGFVETFNVNGQSSAYIGTSIYNQGLVMINDKYGEPYWGEIAE